MQIQSSIQINYILLQDRDSEVHSFKEAVQKAGTGNDDIATRWTALPDSIRQKLLDLTMSGKTPISRHDSVTTHLLKDNEKMMLTDKKAKHTRTYR